MPSANDPPKTIGEIIDHIERIREELLVLQRSMEKMESENPIGTVKKISKGAAGLAPTQSRYENRRS